ncbi:unnamed protein product [Closterium sp. NIES-65]|nr:unnamed protein product [Closterium sp. NIES-65]
MAMYRSVFYASKRGLEGPRSTGGNGGGELDAAEGEIARGEAGDAESPSAARRSAIGIRKMRRQLTSTVWNWASSMEAMLWQGLPHGGVQVVYDIRYGPRLRNTLDIYMPPDLALDSNAAESSNSSSSSSSSNEGSKGRPVLFFVHGGVWASGEKWMYSPLAIRFAQSGAVVVTIQYTLYPEALAIEQVEETSRALSWAMDHIHEYGGDPSRIFLTGHSSGAHVCSMVVWRRLRSALRRMFQAHGKDVASPPTAVAEGDSSSSSSSSGGGGSGSSNSREGELPHYTLKGEDLWSLDEPDLRQPYCFLGMSGVYDIAHHQRHEQARGVFALSAMSPAIGGPARFVASSPALLFDALASAAAAAAAAAAEAAAAGAVGGAAANSAVGDASAAAASFGASFDCPKSPLLTATAARTTATASAPSAPSTSAAARSRALEQLAAVSAAAAASLRPSLSAALKSASPHSIATSAGPNAASEGPDASQLVPLSGGPRSVKPSTDFEASSSQEADPLSSDCFSSRFLAPSPPSPLDILRQELGAGVAESVVAALASGTKDGEEGDEVAEQVLSSGGASDEMACVRDSLDIVTGRVSLEDMVWQ